MDLRSLMELPPWEWPEDARALVEKTLRDRGALEDERALAASLAGDLTLLDDELARELLALVKAEGEPERVRSAAALALGAALELADTDGFDDPDSACLGEALFGEVRRALQVVYADARASKLLRRKALEAAVRAPERWQEGAARAAWAERDDEWRLTAIFCMGFLRTGFEVQLLDALQSANAALRLEALRAAGRTELDEAWPYVEPILAGASRKPTGDEKELLLAAIDAAASIRPGDAAELIEPLRRSRDPEVAEAAAEAHSMALVMSVRGGEVEDDDEDEEDD